MRLIFTLDATLISRIFALTLAHPVDRTVIEYSDRSLTVLWPFSNLTLLWLRTIKKHLKHCNYESGIKFELADVGINTQLAERLHREGLPLVEAFRKWWTTALLLMTGTWCFPSFYRWKIKLLYLFLRLLFQILPRNHNCNVLNVFFIVLSHNNARSENGQRTVRDRSEYSMTVLLTGSTRVGLGKPKNDYWKASLSATCNCLERTVIEYYDRSITSHYYG